MGTAYDGLNKYNEAIASLEKSLDRAEIIPYDGSRVWSTGTLVRDNLKQAVDRRAKVAERARVANQHGVEWRARGEFSRAVPCLIEAAQLQKDCVGDLHLHYATCLNNLGSCVEAMGNYDDAMIKYKTSLKVTEAASPGELRVMVCSARHLPHVMPGGSLQIGEWIEHGQSCDTYVEMQIMHGEGTSDSNKAVQTKVVVDNYQPTWNQVLSLKSPRGDLSVLLRLMGRNPQRVAFEEAAAHKRHLLQGLLGLLLSVLACFCPALLPCASALHLPAVIHAVFICHRKVIAMGLGVCPDFKTLIRLVLDCASASRTGGPVEKAQDGHQSAKGPSPKA